MPANSIQMVTEEDRTMQRKFAIQLVDDTSFEQKLALRDWLKSLLVIRNETGSVYKKLHQIRKVTFQKSLLMPVVKSIAEKVKKHAWDRRSRKGRLQIISITAALTIFAGQGAGIAALGGAIGVPLWIVFGAGAGFAEDIIQLFEKSLQNLKKKDAPYIDAEFEEVKETI